MTEQFLFKAGLANPGALDERDHAAYRAPHPDPSSRTAMLVFPREIPFRARGPVFDLSAENEEGLVRAFRSKPVRLVWGMKDVLFGTEVLSLWQELLPDARATRLDEAGHFVQEDAPEEVTAALLELATELAPG